MAAAQSEFSDVRVVHETQESAQGVLEHEGRRYAFVRLELNEQGMARLRSRICAVARRGLFGFPKIHHLASDGAAAWVVMDEPQGAALAQYVERGVLTDEDVLCVARDVSTALIQLHDIGGVHGRLSLGSIVAGNAGGWGLRDYGACFDRSSLRPSSPPPQPEANRTLSESCADLVALGRVLGACLLHQTEPASMEDIERLKQLKPRFHPLVSGLVAAADGFTTAQQFVERLGARFAATESTAPLAEGNTSLSRALELASLQRWWRRCRGTDVVVLRGPPGSGKSHLVAAFAQQLDARELLWAACRDWDLAPYAVVRQLVEGLVAGPGGASSTGLRELVEEAGNLAPLLRLLSPRFADVAPGFASVRAEAADDVFTEGLSEILVRALRRAPRVVVLDDVQWLDEASRKVLKRVVERADGRLLFVVTARSDVDDFHQAQRFLGTVAERVVSEVELAPLSTEQASALVADYLDGLAIADEHVRALALLGDGTPLSILEVVRSVIDAGLLTPRWGAWRLEVTKVPSLRLPSRTMDLMAQRLKRLAPDTAAVLKLAAILGDEFDARVLAAGIPGSPARALAEAQQQSLLECIGPAEYRFVHRCVREALLGGASPQEISQLHCRATSALSSVYSAALEELPTDVVFRLAQHAVLGGDEVDQRFIVANNLEAAKRAFAAFDNSRASSFLQVVDSIATESQRRTEGITNLIAETKLRLGELQASMGDFERELSWVSNAEARARVLSRLAIIHEAHHDSTRALNCLNRALDTLGEPIPKAGVRVALGVVGLLMGAGDLGGPRSDQEPKRVELLCEIYLQHARLSLVESRVGDVVDGILHGIRVGREVTDPSALSKVYTQRSFLLGVLQQTRASRASTERALELAQGDPPTHAQCLVSQAAVLGWQGDVEGALVLGARAIEEFQNWMIPSELSAISLNQELLESGRGRGQVAWKWLEKAAHRVLQYEGAPLVSELFALRIRVAALHLGLERQVSGMLRWLEDNSVGIPRSSGYYTWTYGARVRVFTETGELGPEFEALVAEFEAEDHDPKRVHLVVTEFYICVAHARVHACFSAGEKLDPERVKALERVARELRATARIPLIAAHADVIEACLHYFRGRFGRAKRHFDSAERLGRQQNMPWVLYTVARGRAHLLASRGEHDAALVQARIAEALAQENGAVHRLRWIRDEFGLGEARRLAPVSATAQHRSRDHEHLEALLRISRASTLALSPSEQSRLVLDEMIRALSASRGFLFLRDGGLGRTVPVMAVKELRRVAARSAQQTDLPEHEAVDPTLLEAALRAKDVQILASATGSSVVAPLMVQGIVLGLAHLEDLSRTDAFTQEDGEVLRALASQVPVSLELAHALRDRERLTEDLRHAQKMEAVGRLAGGIAHDFNNMLAAICVAAETVLLEAPESPHRQDVETILRAADRATRLTRQLLVFSRRQVFDARPINLNESVRQVVPMLQRLLGQGVRLEIELADDVHPVEADAAQIEQVLVNLVVNARDAMPGGGRLKLSTRNVDLEAGSKPGLDAGGYLMLVVADDGHGMELETQRRVFEPFFTTKNAEAGTGLGMAMVYGIVRQSGGHIELESNVGIGTEFRIYLPRTHQVPQTIPPTSTTRSTRQPGAVGGSIILVDDEPLVRQAFARTLRRRGYDVTVFTGARDAIRFLRQHPRVDLVITDVIMPDMNGVEMIEALYQMGIRAKVLYVSGYAGGVLTRRVGLGDDIEFMQKPVRDDDLAGKVESLLARVQRWQVGQ